MPHTLARIGLSASATAKGDFNKAVATMDGDVAVKLDEFCAKLINARNQKKTWTENDNELTTAARDMFADAGIYSDDDKSIMREMHTNNYILQISKDISESFSEKFDHVKFKDSIHGEFSGDELKKIMDIFEKCTKTEKKSGRPGNIKCFPNE